ncbi:MAG: hypothetical protein K9I74_00300, partial [Bacteroidales bacterium]|nr:hypothetical protein [Bacteroidales bacterium]
KQKWLDWDREYKPVWDKGFSIQTTLQIPESFSPEVWNTPVESAYNYGKAYGQYFGSNNPMLVEAAEIGNEPWKYGPQFYKKIFNGMSRGLKESSPRMTVLPCALSANKQRPHLDNYAGDWLNAGMKERIDALNTHLYSFTNNDRGEAVAVHPEHPESEMRGILNMLKFRNSNMPGKPVHITEWGWDASSGAMDCTHNECVTEEAQAAYAIRALLMFYRLNVEKVFWYFFSDEDKPSHRFTRSGLLTSPQNGLKPKKSWHAVKSLILEVGDKFLYDISENNSGAWIYHFKDSSETPSYLVLWLPEKHRPQLRKEITFTTRRKIKRAFLPNAVEEPIPYTSKGGNRYSIKVGTYPVIVELK